MFGYHHKMMKTVRVFLSSGYLIILKGKKIPQQNYVVCVVLISCPLVSSRYYLKESRGSRRWLIFLEGQYSFCLVICHSTHSTIRQ